MPGLCIALKSGGGMGIFGLGRRENEFCFIELFMSLSAAAAAAKEEEEEVLPPGGCLQVGFGQIRAASLMGEGKRGKDGRRRRIRRIFGVNTKKKLVNPCWARGGGDKWRKTANMNWWGGEEEGQMMNEKKNGGGGKNNVYEKKAETGGHCCRT